MKPTRTYIPSLDGIRALSFLIVFVSHAGLGNVVPGGLGVTIFFFLSGFLITTLMRIEMEATGTVDLRQFYLRRVLRIFPPFYVFLGIALLTVALGIVPTQIKWEGIVAQVLYLYNYYAIARGADGIPPGTDIYWSLAVEEHFYLVFPFLYPILHRKVSVPADRALWIAGACVLVLFWRVWLHFGMNAPTLHTYTATDCRIDSILYGILLAVWRNPVLDGLRAGTEIAHRRISAAMVVLGFALLLSTLVIRPVWFRETLRYSLQGLALLPLFQAAIRYPQWWVFRPLNWAPIKFVGVLSYSLYLVHFLVLIALALHFGGRLPVQLGVGLPLCLGLAWAMHQCVERPAARLKSRLSQPKPTSPIPTSQSR